MRDSISLDVYVSERLSVINAATGGRGYDTGVRIFHCPHCGDNRGRGWVNVERWTAGCWNAGCLAEPRIQGGAIEWVRLMEGFPARGQAWRFLMDNYKSTEVFSPVRPQRPLHEVDFCRFPESKPFIDWASLSKMARPAGLFVQRQWGMSVLEAAEWRLRYTLLTGRYAWRIIIPIVMNGEPVGFQARTYRESTTPKYLNSTPGLYSDPKAECGRPAGSMLFNIDSVTPGDEVLLVEGAGDVMAWHRGLVRFPRGVGLLGMALTPEKLTLLAEKGPSRVIVALDNEPEARYRAFTHIDDLVTWGINATLGEWKGGKDAGSGAELVVWKDGSLRSRLEAQLGGAM